MEKPQGITVRELLSVEEKKRDDIKVLTRLRNKLKQRMKQYKHTSFAATELRKRFKETRQDLQELQRLTSTKDLELYYKKNGE